MTADKEMSVINKKMYAEFSGITEVDQPVSGLVSAYFIRAELVESEEWYWNFCKSSTIPLSELNFC